MFKSKAFLRTLMENKRAIYDDHISDYETDKAITQLSYFLLKMTGSCGLYMPFKQEISPLGVMELAPNLVYALPVINGSKMQFYRWKRTDAVARNSFGIDEPVTRIPVTPDIIITPLLGFDARGNRLGYGKGYYDRYFATDGKDALRIGLAYAMQQMHTIPAQDHDVALHATITQHGIMRHIAR